MADNSTCLQEGRTAVQNPSALLAEEALAETLAGGPVQGARQQGRAMKMWSWLTVQQFTVNGRELGAQE